MTKEEIEQEEHIIDTLGMTALFLMLSLPFVFMFGMLLTMWLTWQ